jgi:hypothetical protein
MSLGIWTRKLHNYLGLYLLLWLWLFAVTGLVLNHPKWEIAQFWKRRTEETTQKSIRIPEATGDLAMATQLMGQLAVTGELQETKRNPVGDQFQFQVVKPGRVVRVAANLPANSAEVTEIELNAVGALDALHTFSGVKLEEPTRKRDWPLTMAWSAAMDAVAFGLATLVITGIYLWYRRADRRWPGIVALVLGLALCGFFVGGFGALLH